MQIVLKCADVSHGAKNKQLHVRWTSSILQEFLEQGDQELSEGLKISPLCDRSKLNIAKSQRGFIDFVCRPVFEVYNKLAKMTIVSESELQSVGTLLLFSSALTNVFLPPSLPPPLSLHLEYHPM